MLSEISKAEEQGQRDRDSGKTGVPPKDMTPKEARDYRRGFDGKN